MGLAIARELSRRGVKGIALLEKEKTLGVHASGKNSGVLHAGIYYATDSLKARFCAQGAHLLKSYAASHGIALVPTGKVIVAAREEELGPLEALYQRALQNGIRVEKIPADRLKDIEPCARTVGWALYSPDTAVIDSKGVLQALHKDLTAQGVHIALGEPVQEIRPEQKSIVTSQGTWSYGHLINAAGLQADKLAHQMDAGLSYRIVPFRGRYRKLRQEASDKIRGLIYPVPDPRLPFLGVHFTKSVSGDVWVGPNAELAFGRENYGALSGIDWAELPVLLNDLLQMILRNANGLTRHLGDELRKKMPGGLLSAARALVPTLRAQDMDEPTKCGLRAQLVDIQNYRLVMDFVVERGPDSTHVLNAVSPGFTASFAFAAYVANVVFGEP